VWSVAQMLCFALSLWLLRDILPGLRSPQGALLCIMALLFVPLNTCINGGQNSGFSLLLHTGILTALVRRREAMAGILIALGLFKPQLFLGLLPWLWLGGFGRIVPAFIATAGAIVGITAWFCGAARFTEWWRIAFSPFYQSEAFSQAHGMYSWTSFWELLLGNTRATYWLGYACAAVIFAALAWCWLRYRHRDEQDQKRGTALSSCDVPVLYALSVCGIVLMSPHLGAYDLTLLVLPGIIFAERALAIPLHHHMALRLCLLGVYAGVVLIDQALWTRIQFVVPLLTATALLAVRLLPYHRSAFSARTQGSTA
jgi:hypothetical protein